MYSTVATVASRPAPPYWTVCSTAWADTSPRTSAAARYAPAIAPSTTNPPMARRRRPGGSRIMIANGAKTGRSDPGERQVEVDGDAGRVRRSRVEVAPDEALRDLVEREREGRTARGSSRGRSTLVRVAIPIAPITAPLTKSASAEKHTDLPRLVDGHRTGCVQRRNLTLRQVAGRLPGRGDHGEHATNGASPRSSWTTRRSTR